MSGKTRAPTPTSRPARADTTTSAQRGAPPTTSNLADRRTEHTVVEYELIKDKPWPAEGAKEVVNRYERDRKRRKAGRDRHGDLE